MFGRVAGGIATLPAHEDYAPATPRRARPDGTAPIHLTITWEGNRLRLGTGAVVRPEHWDAEARRVKAQKGTLHASTPALTRA